MSGDDVAAFAERSFAATETVRGLRKEATPKGYGVAAITSTMANGGANEETAEWYRVYPLDHPEESEVFESADAARAYIDAAPSLIRGDGDGSGGEIPS